MIVWDVLFKVINFNLIGLGDTNSGASVVEKTSWWITTDVPKTKRAYYFSLFLNLNILLSKWQFFLQSQVLLY